ncbi:MAG: arylamine N-acetyltransferase, partial [Chloroflexota bacterium]
MNVQAYLDRINYRGSLDRSIETLSALQLAHLHAVPFENLSIHNDEPIILEERLLFDKVIKRRRG